MPSSESYQKSRVEDGHWFAISTRYKHEKKVKRLLEYKGYTVYLPLKWQVRSWKDRTAKVGLPLFTCYVFVFVDLKHQWDILNTTGVVNFVAFENRPVVIPESQIDLMRTVLSANRVVKAEPKFKSGMGVKVVDGPLRGLQGIYLKSRDRCRLLIAIDNFDQNLSIEINAQEVVPLKRMSPSSSV